ncbi:uncharacterized protein At5g01610-like isoform X1 [Salvia hispanica]|uniref:uncharacterized protein At5g01610-like isoform X1 n=1 Tax=Salvia hispanica TaxID=49212 RepID=UPI002009150F|nr:uncharacterized protein At5g01610-like isoform X1 [Salvia hispanica]
MDQVFSKASSFWLKQKASNEFGSVGKDGNSLSSSIEGGTKWLVNTIKGKVQKPLPELLKEYDLAIGIFPRDATSYDFDEETKKLKVYIPKVCEVGYKDQSVLRFATEVSGCMEKGKLSEIVGIKTKVIVWMKVSCITSDKTNLHFQATVTRSRSRAVYEVEKDGTVCGKF